MKKLCLGLLACSAFAGMFLAGTEDADAAFRRRARRANKYYSASSNNCCQPTGQAAAGQYSDPSAPPAPTDPGAPPGASAQPTPAAPPPVPGS